MGGCALLMTKARLMPQRWTRAVKHKQRRLSLKLLNLPMYLGLLIPMTACTPADTPPQSVRAAPVAEPPSSLRLAFRFSAQGQPLGGTSTGWRAGSGQALTLSRAAMLLSGFQLCSQDSACVLVPNAVAYLDLQSSKLHLDLPQVPQRQYTQLRFQVGLPADINHGDPAQYAPGHPLHPLENGLHWGWAGGYVFAALEGHYSGSSLPVTAGFVYHLANNANLTPVSVPVQLAPNDQRTLLIDIDVGRLIDAAAPDGVAPGESASTHSRDDDVVLQRIAAVLPTVFAQFSAPRAASQVSPLRRNTAPVAVPGVDSAAPSDATASATKLVTSSPYLTHPPGFPQARLPADNILTEAGVALGQRLFFDPRLSKDRTLSCATCHPAERGFVDAGRPFSRGVGGRHGSRRTMPLTNLAWASHLAWDGQQSSIRAQALSALLSPVEMAMQRPVVEHRLRSDARYRRLFAKAFDGAAPELHLASLALEQYVLTLTAADSRLDRALAREIRLNDQELQGLKLFMSEHDPARGVRGGDCFHCHGGPLFTMGGFHNNGLDKVFKDAGRMQATGRKSDAGKFKAPSLRNVALRPPYMHDGRFKTLEEVIEHYSSGTLPSGTLDPNIAKHPNQAGLGLTAGEKAALVALLRALTDVPLLPRQQPGVDESGRKAKPVAATDRATALSVKQ
jgi:cytochrome c peroxidase